MVDFVGMVELFTGNLRAQACARQHLSSHQDGVSDIDAYTQRRPGTAEMARGSGEKARIKAVYVWGTRIKRADERQLRGKGGVKMVFDKKTLHM